MNIGLCGCGCGGHTNIAKKTRTAEGWIAGQPTPFVRGHNNSRVYVRTPEEPRFWAKVDRSGGPEACWPWTAGRFPNGYGCFDFRGRHLGAHRIADILTNGPIPDGLVVCHRCDNKACCNPAHLFRGTQMDNLRDMRAKGRARYTGAKNPASGDRSWLRRYPERVLRGERCGTSKLTEAQVAEIRALRGMRQRDIAKIYGVCQSTIGNILRGLRWAHVNHGTGPTDPSRPRSDSGPLSP